MWTSAATLSVAQAGSFRILLELSKATLSFGFDTRPRCADGVYDSVALGA